MAYPNFTRTSGNSTADSTTHSITLPSTVNSGDLLLIVVSVDGDPTTMSFSGAGTWTSLYNTTGSLIARCAQWKVADGTENAANVTLTLGAAQQAAWHIFQITGHGSSVETVNSYNGSGTAITFTTSLSPSWGSAETLWIAVGHASNAPTVTYPSDYSNGLRTVSSGADNTLIWSATLNQTSTSETPNSDGTLSASQQQTNYIIAIKPAASGLTITSVNTTNTAFSAQTDSAVIGTGLSASVVCTYAGIACTNESASSSTSLKITFPNFFTNNIKLGRNYEFKVVG